MNLGVIAMLGPVVGLPIGKSWVDFWSGNLTNCFSSSNNWFRFHISAFVASTDINSAVSTGPHACVRSVCLRPAGSSEWGIVASFAVSPGFTGAEIVGA